MDQYLQFFFLCSQKPGMLSCVLHLDQGTLSTKSQIKSFRLRMDSDSSVNSAPAYDLL